MNEYGFILEIKLNFCNNSRLKFRKTDTNFIKRNLFRCKNLRNK